MGTGPAGDGCAYQAYLTFAVANQPLFGSGDALESSMKMALEPNFERQVKAISTITNQALAHFYFFEHVVVEIQEISCKNALASFRSAVSNPSVNQS
jgi:hypothetical protein